MNARVVRADDDLEVVAEDESGVPVANSVTFNYRPDIKSLRGPETPKLTSVTTIGRRVGSRVDLSIDNVASTWFGTAGAADPEDEDGQVAPDDYDVVHNNFHWEKGGGL